MGNRRFGSIGAVLAVMLFDSLTFAQVERPKNFSDYKCGQTVGQAPVVNLTLAEGNLLIQAVGKIGHGRLTSIGGVLSNVAVIREKTTEGLTSEELLTSAMSPLRHLSSQKKQFLSDELKSAKEHQTREPKTPGEFAIHSVAIVEAQDGSGKFVWTVQTNKALVNRDGQFQMGDNEGYTIFLTDKNTGLMTATKYIGFENAPKDSREKAVANYNVETIEKELPTLSPPVPPQDRSLSPRPGDAVFPRIGENIGKAGTLTFDADLDAQGLIRSVRYRIANSPTQVESSKSPQSVIELLKVYTPQLEKLASCCVNDAPSYCMSKYRPGGVSNSAAGARSAPPSTVKSKTSR